MGHLSIILGTTDIQGDVQWYWAMRSPSGPVACYSPYFSCIELAAQAARAFIFNMNYGAIIIPEFDDRIKPTTDSARFEVPYEIWFRDFYLNMVQSEQSEAVENETPPQPDFKTPVKKGHLSLVTE